MYGYEVEILEQLENEFSKVKTHYGYEGFIHNCDLIFDEKLISSFNTPKQMIINHFAVDVRSDTKVQSVTLITLTKGCIVTTFENYNGWVKTILIDGRVGYIKEKFLSEICNIQDFKNFNDVQKLKFREDIVKTAFEYMSTQYKWGGKSPLGIDCSGLASISYLLNGVIIYRDAKIIDGFPIKKINIENIDKGDLIFFPGHVAIYIGNDEYIHSSSSNDGVYVNSLNSKSDNYSESLAKTITEVGSIF